MPFQVGNGGATVDTRFAGPPARPGAYTFATRTETATTATTATAAASGAISPGQLCGGYAARRRGPCGRPGAGAAWPLARIAASIAPGSGACRSSVRSAARRSSSSRIGWPSRLSGMSPRRRAHLDAQRRERPGRVTADRARAAAEQFRDLGVTAVLVVAQDEHRALPPGQLAELGEQGLALGVLLRVIRYGTRRLKGRTAGRYLARRPAAPAQELVEHHLADVEFRPVKAADPVPPGVRANQHLLGQVLRGRPVTCQDRGELQHPRHPLGGELLEGHRVSVVLVSLLDASRPPIC